MQKQFFFLGFVFLQACSQTNFGKLEQLATLSSDLKEISGIDQDANKNLWAIEDSGNKDLLFKIDLKGKTHKKLKIEHAKNEDWEDITIAKDGSIFIGDFGNNDNKRKNLVVYKIPEQELEKHTPKAQKIKFSYPEQTAFPPEKAARLFDAEGFLHWGQHLYIFTKNRSRPYSGKTFVYRIPDTAGEYSAELVGQFTLCKDQDHCSVTGADISSDGKTIALIGYGFIYVLSNFESLDQLSTATISTVDLNYTTQIESVCFLNDDTLLIADEKTPHKGGNLYQYRLKK